MARQSLQAFPLALVVAAVCHFVQIARFAALKRNYQRQCDRAYSDYFDARIPPLTWTEFKKIASQEERRAASEARLKRLENAAGASHRDAIEQAARARAAGQAAKSATNLSTAAAEWERQKARAIATIAQRNKERNLSDGNTPGTSGALLSARTGDNPDAGDAGADATHARTPAVQSGGKIAGDDNITPANATGRDVASAHAGPIELEVDGFPAVQIPRPSADRFVFNLSPSVRGPNGAAHAGPGGRPSGNPIPGNPVQGTSDGAIEILCQPMPSLPSGEGGTTMAAIISESATDQSSHRETSALIILPKQVAPGFSGIDPVSAEAQNKIEPLPATHNTLLPASGHVHNPGNARLAAQAQAPIMPSAVPAPNPALPTRHVAPMPASGEAVPASQISIKPAPVAPKPQLPAFQPDHKMAVAAPVRSPEVAAHANVPITGNAKAIATQNRIERLPATLENMVSASGTVQSQQPTADRPNSKAVPNTNPNNTANAPMKGNIAGKTHGIPLPTPALQSSLESAKLASTVKSATKASTKQSNTTPPILTQQISPQPDNVLVVSTAQIAIKPEFAAQDPRLSPRGTLNNMSPTARQLDSAKQSTTGAQDTVSAKADAPVQGKTARISQGVQPSVPAVHPAHSGTKPSVTSPLPLVQKPIKQPVTATVFSANQESPNSENAKKQNVKPEAPMPEFDTLNDFDYPIPVNPLWDKIFGAVPSYMHGLALIYIENMHSGYGNLAPENLKQHKLFERHLGEHAKQLEEMSWDQDDMAQARKFFGHARNQPTPPEFLPAVKASVRPAQVAHPLYFANTKPRPNRDGRD